MRYSRYTFVPLLLLLGAGLTFLFTHFDIRALEPFYDSDTGQWKDSDQILSITSQIFGVWPAVLLLLAGLILLIGGYLYDYLTPFRRTGIFLIAATLLGPGLLATGVIQKMWERPPPAAHENFQPEGDLQLPAPGTTTTASTTPQNLHHVATAFILFAPYFIFLGRFPRLALLFLCLGLGGGLLMGLIRMFAGQQFPSEILLTGGIIYVINWGLYALLRPDTPFIHEEKRPSPLAQPEPSDPPTVPDEKDPPADKNA